MRTGLIAALAVLALCACEPKAKPPAQEAQATVASTAACPDDGPRLPETGICTGRAYAYLDDNNGAREAALPAGCTWTINETMLPGGEALLYRAATCKGVTTKLAYAGGAHSASLSYAASAVFGAAAQGQEVIKLFGVEPDPQGALKAAIADLPPAQRNKCAIGPAGVDVWPSDALVIALTKEARAKIKKDGPIAMCGPLGKDEGSARYWRIKQGFAWFFDLGQDDPDFDPNTITVIKKTADGGWGAKK